MNNANIIHQRVSPLSRISFAMGVVLLVPGIGPTFRAAPPATEKPGVAGAGQGTDDSAGEAKSQTPAKEAETKPQGLLKTVRADLELERLGAYVGSKNLTLPNIERVLRGVRLTEDQIAQITKLETQREERLKQGRQGTLNLKLSGPQETFDAQIVEFVNRETGVTLIEILSPIQCKWLEHYILTGQGVGAFIWPDVQKKLRLSTEQQNQIHTIIEEAFDRLRTLEKELGGPPKDFESSIALMKKVDPLFKGALEQVLALLTREQSDQWKAMTREPSRDDEAESRPTPKDR
ncbi:hypothetical protein V5E97_31005 [Singulisphaera sp. Ch08]|uniref:DUF1002 domain-containing protein n=1 Tax=Singulisphaera sp. Ch08 TaxID=3120278 RepID=A0AAU7CC70_9BACT